MKTVHIFYRLAKANFLERVRRYSFLVTLGGAVYLGYNVVAGNFRMMFGPYRGVNNSPWVGLQMALTAGTLLPLVGFYLVKNAVELDLQTRAGEILASTPLSKTAYLFGKALSNFAVLGTVLAVLAVVATLGQLRAGEDLKIRPWEFLSPFLMLALPAAAFVSALALLFETVPLLRGGAGNILYFFLWLVLQSPRNGPFADVSGWVLIESRVSKALAGRLPGYHGGIAIGVVKYARVPKTVVWEGIDWDPHLVFLRLYWFAVACALLMLAVVFFDRFDRARRSLGNGLPPVQASGRLRRPARGAGVQGTESLRDRSSFAAPRAPGRPGPVRPASGLAASATLVLAELRLMLKGRRWWWYTGAGALLMLSLFAPLQAARQVVLPLAWIWPVLLWSGLGTREARHGTEQLVYSAPQPLYRQLPATWLAGAALAIVMGSGVAFRILLVGDAVAMTGWMAGAFFIPSLALALGVWSRSSKLFEVTYTIWWYTAGQAAKLDFMFRSPESFSTATLRGYLLATPLLLTAAIVGRWRVLRR
jgi:hypothetical protein